MDGFAWPYRCQYPCRQTSWRRCRVFSAAPIDYDVIYEAQHDREKDADLIQKFRASGDELLIDQLVRCSPLRVPLRQPAPAQRSDLFELHRG